MKVTQKPRLFTVFLLLTLSLTAVFAQRGTGQRTPKYDSATEVTLKATIQEVKEQGCPSCGRNQTGTHLTVQAEGSTFDVHLGPTRFLTKNNFTFAKGESVEIIGSKVKVGEAEAVLAREVKRSGQTLTLRNAQGIPAWAGGRRGR